MIENTRIDKGRLFINDRPVFAISGDYPYYRDNKNNWEDRLVKIKNLGAGIITFYVPWRHHVVKQDDVYTFDFDGKTSDSRDVRYFINLCREIGLLIIIKPGPFIHAETDFGGLPDFVSSDVDSDIEPYLDSRLDKRRWFKSLPAPLGEKYLGFVKEWYEAVDRELISPNYDIIAAIQILNEGIYSDAQRSPMEYDFSTSSIYMFRNIIQQEYKNIEEYNSAHNTGYSSFQEICPPSSFDNLSSLGRLVEYKDWTSYQSQYMKAIYRTYGNIINNRAPYIINLNPPLSQAEGVDYWLSRLEIEKFSNVSYGYTNWIGVVSHDKNAYDRYLILTKRRRGINLEENWSFSQIYDSRYKYCIIPFYQTLLAIAGGAAGFNIYTAVNTSNWNDKLDTKHQKPYPDSSPIDEYGETGHKYRSLSLLTAYFNKYGEEFLECDAREEVIFALYNDYANCASVTIDSEEYKRLGVKPVRAGYKGLLNFQDIVQKLNLDYGISNIKYDSIQDKGHLFLVGGFFMDMDTQSRIVNYVKNGGILFICNDIPYMDEHFKNCTVLQDEICRNIGEEVTYCIENIRFTQVPVDRGKIIFTHSNLFEGAGDMDAAIFERLLQRYGLTCRDLVIEGNSCSVWIYEKQDIQHHIILSRVDRIEWHTVEDKKNKVKYQMLLPSKGCAVLRFSRGEMTAALIKGLNEYEGSYVCPQIKFKDRVISVKNKCDVLMIANGDGMLTKEEVL